VIEALVSDYGAKGPRAVAKITDDKEALLAFFDFVRLRTGALTMPLSPSRNHCQQAFSVR
jgi:hypothetical protein